MSSIPDRVKQRIIKVEFAAPSLNTQIYVGVNNNTLAYYKVNIVISSSMMNALYFYKGKDNLIFFGLMDR